MMPPSASQETPNHLHGLVDRFGSLIVLLVVHDRRAVWFSRVDFHVRSASASELALASALQDNSSRIQSKMRDLSSAMVSTLPLVRVQLAADSIYYSF
ncbi:hypothetical protein EUGRSUZ_E03944 [Eucalyptus grandis]|uniref:Uncharacterized protein n=2 Tax=Eucalyptus grandis TaxID=71139 RepID=A0ACC3L2U0_EUCGR|nr:hypothetical protein EUGRSUZ_E03944 [Eucalyptus grandis]